MKPVQLQNFNATVPKTEPKLQKLTDENIVTFKEKLTKEEIYNVVKEMPLAKVLGSDGLPVKWYRTLSKDIGKILFDSH